MGYDNEMKEPLRYVYKLAIIANCYIQISFNWADFKPYNPSVIIIKLIATV